VILPATLKGDSLKKVLNSVLNGKDKSHFFISWGIKNKLFLFGEGFLNLIKKT